VVFTARSGDVEIVKMRYLTQFIMIHKIFSRKIPTIIVALITCGYLSSCALPPPPTKEAVASATMFYKDPYTGVSSIQGPLVVSGYTSPEFSVDDNTVSTLEWRLAILDNKTVACLLKHGQLNLCF